MTSSRTRGFTLLELLLALGATAALLVLAAGAVRDADAARARTAARAETLARTEQALQVLRDDLATSDAEAIAVAGKGAATTVQLARREPVPAVVTWGLEDGALVRRERLGRDGAGPAARDVVLDGVDALRVRCATREGWTTECAGAVQAVAVELQPASGAPLTVHVRLAGRRS
jgi:type II secretory pathway pseudopilin PulG